MFERKPLPSYETLHEYFKYDKETGNLFWKISSNNRVKAGDLITCQNAFGYLLVALKYNQYLVHRIIWKMVTSEEPPYELDHKDCNTLNNKFDNLRPADRLTNLCNTRKHRRNINGVKGVTWDKKSKAWNARICVNYNRINLGYFATLEEAAKVRKDYADNLRGEFTREGINAEYSIKGEL